MVKSIWIYLLGLLAIGLFAWLQAPLAAPVVVYSSDFESNNGGMSGTLDWEWGIYSWTGNTCSGTNYPPPSAHSGNHMWATQLNTCYNNLGNNAGYDTCVNGNTNDDSILSFTVDLTGLTEATLSWWEWQDIYLNWDWAEVYVNNTVVFQHCGTEYAPSTVWGQQSVDLTTYVGASVNIRFHMMSSSVVERAGWFIDDVQVSGSTPDPIPTLSEWGMIIFTLLLGGSGLLYMQKRKALNG